MHCAVRFVVHTTYRTVHALHRCSTFVQQSFQRVVHGPAITSHAVWNQWPCNGSSARGTRPVSSRALVLTSVTTSTSTTRGTTDALTGARLADTTAPLLRPPPPVPPSHCPLSNPPPRPSLRHCHHPPPPRRLLHVLPTPSTARLLPPVTSSLSPTLSAVASSLCLPAGAGSAIHPARQWSLVLVGWGRGPPVSQAVVPGRHR